MLSHQLIATHVEFVLNRGAGLAWPHFVSFYVQSKCNVTLSQVTTIQRVCQNHFPSTLYVCTCTLVNKNSLKLFILRFLPKVPLEFKNIIQSMALYLQFNILMLQSLISLVIFSPYLRDYNNMLHLYTLKVIELKFN